MFRTAALAVEAYRNLTRRSWSVRAQGRVVEHVETLTLADVTPGLSRQLSTSILAS